MERRFLHPEGPELSRIIAGAWRWNDTDVTKLINTSIEAGITSFDHADIYGDYENEKIFGDALKKTSVKRASIELITKCGIKLLSSKHAGTSVKHYDTSKGHILNCVDHSLKNLSTDYLDVLLIHRPDPLLDPAEVAEAFGLLKQNGKVRFVGVSNFTVPQFEMLQSYLSFPLVTNQLEISLSKLDCLFDGSLDTLLKHRTSPMAWSPLGGGKLVAGSSSIWIKKDKYRATETQLSLAWLLAHPSKIFPVIGTTQPGRITEAAKSIDIKLERQDWFEMLKTVTGRDVP